MGWCEVGETLGAFSNFPVCSPDMKTFIHSLKKKVLIKHLLWIGHCYTREEGDTSEANIKDLLTAFVMPCPVLSTWGTSCSQGQKKTETAGVAFAFLQVGEWANWGLGGFSNSLWAPELQVSNLDTAQWHVFPALVPSGPWGFSQSTVSVWFGVLHESGWATDKKPQFLPFHPVLGLRKDMEWRDGCGLG